MGGMFSAFGGRVAGSIEDAGMGGTISSIVGKMLGGGMPIPGGRRGVGSRKGEGVRLGRL